jgi:hypothetical protein
LLQTYNDSLPTQENAAPIPGKVASRSAFAAFLSVKLLLFQLSYTFLSYTASIPVTLILFSYTAPLPVTVFLFQLPLLVFNLFF